MSKKELTKEQRISKEERKLKQLVKMITDKEKLSIANNLIPRLAYHLISLEDLEKDLNENGYVEMFTQSPNSPPYERERVTAKQYTTHVKTYQSLNKQFLELFEKTNNDTDNDDDGFDDFVSKK